MNRGRNNFDTIRYDYYRDETVPSRPSRRAKSIIARSTPRGTGRSPTTFPPSSRARIQRATLKHESTLPMQCLGFNLRRELFKDRRVREAIVHLFDFEWFNKTLSYGLLTRINSYFFNSELAATGLPSKEELEVLEPLRGKIPEEVFTQEFKLPVTDGSGNNREGARRAIALLKEAGWEIKDGKMTSKATGQPFSFEMLLGEPRLERFALPFKQWAGEGRHRGARAHRRHGAVPEAHGRLRLRHDDRDLLASRCRPATSSANSGAPKPPAPRAAATPPASPTRRSTS